MQRQEWRGGFFVIILLGEDCEELVQDCLIVQCDPQ